MAVIVFEDLAEKQIMQGEIDHLYADNDKLRAGLRVGCLFSDVVGHVDLFLWLGVATNDVMKVRRWS